jgi:hypothetical protein
MNIRIHWFAKPNGITREQKKSAKGLNLVEFLFAIIAANLDPIFLD